MNTRRCCHINLWRRRRKKLPLQCIAYMYVEGISSNTFEEINFPLKSPATFSLSSGVGLKTGMLLQEVKIHFGSELILKYLNTILGTIVDYPLPTHSFKWKWFARKKTKGTFKLKCNSHTVIIRNIRLHHLIQALSNVIYFRTKCYYT